MFLLSLSNYHYLYQLSLSPIIVVLQEIESQLERSDATYGDKVNAVLSGWDSLAGTASTSATHMLPLASFLYRWVV